MDEDLAERHREREREKRERAGERERREDLAEGDGGLPRLVRRHHQVLPSGTP